MENTQIIPSVNLQLDKKGTTTNYNRVNSGKYNGFPVSIRTFHNPSHQNQNSIDIELNYLDNVIEMSKCENNRLVKLLGMCDDLTLYDDKLGFVIEMTEKGNLYGLLHTKNSVKIGNLMKKQISCEIIEGMKFLHTRGIIHRNLQTKNILITLDYHVKISEIEYVQSNQEDLEFEKRDSIRYLAPEVINGHKYTKASDVYSFGVISWELITELIPWDKLNNGQIIKAVVKDNERLSFPIDIRDEYWKESIEKSFDLPEKRLTFDDLHEILLEKKLNNTEILFDGENENAKIHEKSSKIENFNINSVRIQHIKVTESYDS
jgi:serine/threonine protein kinase